MSAQASCDLVALVVFLGALVAGTACSLTSKIMLSMQSIGLTGELENFSYPLFQTLGMFIGMMLGLVVHHVVISYKIPFPGYAFPNLVGKHINFNGEEVEAPKSLPTWMFFLLIIPSIFDLVATSLCMFGLRYVDVSIYQMLRGGAIVFVAILKQFVIGHRLRKYQWLGVLWNVVSIVIVGMTALLNSSVSASSTNAQPHAEGPQNHYNDPLVGVFLILMGAFVQSLQYAFEEKVMNMDIPAPPMLLIGMEGLWGTLLCVLVLYPLAYYTPGPDHGCIENPFNTIAMIQNSPAIQKMFVFYFVSVFLYNMLGVLVTCILNSVWHAILDNFRPISVWGTDLFIFYFISRAFGEDWTMYSWLQLGGMFVLLYGTAIYNAPNQGSLKLTGQWFGCGLDFSEEYEDAMDEEEDGVAPPASSLSLKSPLWTPRSAVNRTPNRRQGDYLGIAMTPPSMSSYGGTVDYGSAQKPVQSVQHIKKQMSFK